MQPRLGYKVGSRMKPVYHGPVPSRDSLARRSPSQHLLHGRVVASSNGILTHPLYPAPPKCCPTTKPTRRRDRFVRGCHVSQGVCERLGRGADGGFLAWGPNHTIESFPLPGLRELHARRFLLPRQASLPADMICRPRADPGEFRHPERKTSSSASLTGPGH